MPKDTRTAGVLRLSLTQAIQANWNRFTGPKNEFKTEESAVQEDAINSCKPKTFETLVQEGLIDKTGKLLHDPRRLDWRGVLFPGMAKENLEDRVYCTVNSEKSHHSPLQKTKLRRAASMRI